MAALLCRKAGGSSTKGLCCWYLGFWEAMHMSSNIWFLKKLCVMLDLFFCSSFQLGPCFSSFQFRHWVLLSSLTFWWTLSLSQSCSFASCFSFVGMWVWSIFFSVFFPSISLLSFCSDGLCFALYLYLKSFNLDPVYSRARANEVPSIYSLFSSISCRQPAYVALKKLLWYI